MRTRTTLRQSSPNRYRRSIATLSSFLFLSAVAPATAQYMYLDSNGDGINTTEDQVQANGPTHVTVWFDTGHNRDGTPVSCNSNTGQPSGSQPLDMFSYDFLLEVTNRDENSVTWGAYGDSLNFPNDFGTQTSSFFVSISRFSIFPTALPAGRYKLGALDVTVASGAPAINISPFIAGSPVFVQNNFTGFGTHCDATQYANTYTLGFDWFDTDGLGAPSTVTTPAPARVYTTNSGETFRLRSGKPTLCMQIEPTNAAYENTSVELNTITMFSQGTGSVNQILVAGDKTVVGADRDRNGIQEITACFARSDLERLFSEVHGRRDVPITVEGRLQSGRIFRGTTTLDVIGDRAAIRASVSPNPLNPEATLRFVTELPGPLRVRVFDVNARLVRELLNEESAAAGEHAIRIDGRGQDGSTLSSGIYFYRVESRGAATSGRFAILR